MNTADDVLAEAEAMAIEYSGQAERAASPTQQFALAAKSLAMHELIIRIRYKQNGEKQA